MVLSSEISCCRAVDTRAMLPISFTCHLPMGKCAKTGRCRYNYTNGFPSSLMLVLRFRAARIPNGRMYTHKRPPLSIGGWRPCQNKWGNATACHWLQILLVLTPDLNGCGRVGPSPATKGMTHDVRTACSRLIGQHQCEMIR